MMNDEWKKDSSCLPFIIHHSSFIISTEMLSLFRTLSLRYLWKHGPRSVLVIVSIALGVATWVATDALSRALDSSLKQAVTPLGIADLYVTNTAKGGVDPTLAERVEKVPGVKRVDPLVIEKVTAARNEADL